MGALFGSLVLSEEVVRKPKLFLSAPAPLPQHYKQRLYVMSQPQHMPLALGEKGEPSPPLVDGNRSSAETRRSRFQSTRGRKWRQGRKIPTLLDHHHLHLYLHLSHYHIFSFKRSVHSSRGKKLWSIVCSPYL